MRTDIAELLEALERGEPGAEHALFSAAYVELRRIANAQARRVDGSLTLNPTGLVHEAWLKFSSSGLRSYQSSAHFYNLMARVMRQVLLDLSRRRAAMRRGARPDHTELTNNLESEDKPIEDLLTVEAAIEQVRACDADLAQLIEWHVFAGLSLTEIARIRGVTERTAKRHWASACALLSSIVSEPGSA
jgi:RNA polymerase sigma factor (TIGR02999 family)